jgi:hypothetical protein
MKGAVAGKMLLDYLRYRRSWCLGNTARSGLPRWCFPVP